MEQVMRRCSGEHRNNGLEASENDWISYHPQLMPSTPRALLNALFRPQIWLLEERNLVEIALRKMRHKVSDGTAAAAAADLWHKKNPKPKSFSRRGQIKMRIASLAFKLLRGLAPPRLLSAAAEALLILWFMTGTEAQSCNLWSLMEASPRRRLGPEPSTPLESRSKVEILPSRGLTGGRTPTHYLAAFTGVATHRQSPAHRSVSHSHRPLLRPWFFSFTSQGVFLPIPLSAFQNPKSDSPNSI
nr:hypothetical protein Iba_chr05fCG9510 [Ipomoea batatas]